MPRRNIVNKGPQIVELLKLGLGYQEIETKLNVAKSTVSWHATRHKLNPNKYKYDWEVIQKYHDEGNGRRECMKKFGFTQQAWFDAVKRNDILTKSSRDWVLPIEELLVTNRLVGTGHIKGRLIREGLLENKCLWCGINTWRGLPLVLQLDHINGDNKDNRLENLRLLCANCHSQTPTFCGKGKVLKRLAKLS